MRCACGLEFCFHHATAHPLSEACDDYLRRTADVELDRQLAAFSVECPGCSARVGKSSGCNTMHCRCGAAFCFLCGKKFGVNAEGAGWHFNPANMDSACRGAQFSGGRPGSRPQKAPRGCLRGPLRCLQVLLAVPMILVSPAVVLLCFALTMPCMILGFVAQLLITIGSCVSFALRPCLGPGCLDDVVRCACQYQDVEDLSENILYIFMLSPPILASAWLCFAFGAFGCGSMFALEL